MVLRPRARMELPDARRATEEPVDQQRACFLAHSISQPHR
jgi:hypothetical protein